MARSRGCEGTRRRGGCMRSDQILARTMKYGDELTLLEQGKAVEREQFIESTYNPLSTMPQMLRQRVFSKSQDVRRWEKQDDYAAIAQTTLAGPNPHGIECPCDSCQAAVKRLLIDVGVLPSWRWKWRIKTRWFRPSYWRYEL